jgi:hypothetical protein
LNIGRIGIKWGETHRSQIFFVAFWVSMISFVIAGVSLACTSTAEDTVRSVPFFYGSISIPNKSTNVPTFYDFYGGLNSLVIDGCDESGYCPPESQLWDEHCDSFFSSCSECKETSAASVTPVVMLFVTLIPQIVTDLGRSTGKCPVKPFLSLP